MSEIATDMEEAFWSHDMKIPDTDEARAAVRAAIEFMADEGHDPLVDARIQNAVQAACDTQPSEGHRMARIWSALGQDFGDADSIEWGFQRNYIRLFSLHPEAVEAVRARDDSFPPLGSIVR